MILEETAKENWQNFKELCNKIAAIFVKPAPHYKKYRRKPSRLIENPPRRETIYLESLDLNEAEIDQILARIGNDFTFSGEGK